MEQTYKDLVIEQLAYRIADLENYAKQLMQENQQLKKELSEATVKDNVVDFPQP